MKYLYILLICLILFYILSRYFEKYYSQENFDPSLVPVSSIITLAKVAQKIVDGNGTLTNPANLNIGTTNAKGNLLVTGNTRTNGNEIVDGTLGVTGATTLSNTLSVAGVTTLNTLGVTGATTLNTLGVTGATTLTGGVTGNTNFAAATIGSSIIGTPGASTTTNLTVNGASKITGNTTVGGTLGVTDNTTIGGTLGVTGNTTLNAVSAASVYAKGINPLAMVYPGDPATATKPATNNTYVTFSARTKAAGAINFGCDNITFVDSNHNANSGSVFMNDLQVNKVFYNGTAKNKDGNDTNYRIITTKYGGLCTGGTVKINVPAYPCKFSYIQHQGGSYFYQVGIWDDTGAWAGVANGTSQLTGPSGPNTNCIISLPATSGGGWFMTLEYPG